MLKNANKLKLITTATRASYLLLTYKNVTEVNGHFLQNITNL